MQVWFSFPAPEGDTGVIAEGLGYSLALKVLFGTSAVLLEVPLVLGKTEWENSDLCFYDSYFGAGNHLYVQSLGD
jgi:hypothetical protein